MRTPSGDETGSPPQHVSREKIRADVGHSTAGQRERGAGDTAADACARQLVDDLEEAVVVLEGRPAEATFEHARRKADHIEDLRRMLGVLLDVLADWEMLAERA